MLRLLSILVLSAAPAIAAAGPPRYTTVFQEATDGRKQPASAAEVALVRALMNAGLPIVDNEQAREIRSVTDAGTVVAGVVPDVITSLDADVIVFAVASVSRVESAMLGKEAARYDAAIDAKVIAVDTAQVLGVFTVRAHALELRAEKAAKLAAEKAGAALAEQILAKVPRELASPAIELSISGVPDVAAGEALVAAIRALEQVEDVEVLQAGRGTTKLRVKTSGAGARVLALALGGAAGTGLSVFGYTANAIKAELAPARGEAVSVVVAELTPSDRGARPSWHGSALAEILRTSLSASDVISTDEHILPARATRDLRGALAAIGAGDRAVVLLGTHRTAGEMVEVEVRAVSAPSREALFTRRASCAKERLTACVAELGDAVARALPAKLARGAPPARAERKPLELSQLIVEDIFPARYASYATRPLGTVRLTNRGSEPLRRIVLSARVPGLGDTALDTPVEDLAPGASVDAPVKIVLDRDRLAREDQNRPAVLVLGVAYESGGYRVEQSATRAVLVWDRNAVSWRDDASIGAFVTAKDPAVVRRAKAAHGAVRAEDRSDPLALPIAVFTAMKGLAYSPDPAHPYRKSDVDYVLFPAETLAVGGGDCDDLAVLYAALAEAIDVPAVLVTTPGHVFAAADTGLPARNAALVTTDPTRVLIHDGRVFVPIETTRPGASFAEAWAAASAQIAGGAAIIDVRRAWEKYPPVSFGAGGDAGLPAGLAAAIADAVDAARRARSTELERALAALDAKSDDRAAALNAKGVLLASAGRYPDAAAAFEEAVNVGPNAGALNNLGNVRLIRGDAKDALARYTRALELAPDRAAIHINAAIAAWLLGDETAFGEHIAGSLALGAEQQVTELAESGLARIAGGRGDEGAARRARFSGAIEAQMRRAGKVLPRPAETRASEAGALPAVSVTRFVYWL